MEIRLRHPPRWTRLCGPTGGGSYPVIDPVIGSILAISAISFVLAASVAFALQLLPAALHEGWFSLPYAPLLAVCLVAFVAAGAYAASFVGQTMTDLVDSSLHEWRFDLEFERAARFAAGGLGSLLAGPILFLAGGLWYWLHCGEMAAIDWVILGELTLAGIGGWLAVTCGSAAIGEFALIRPARFRAALRRIGCRGAGIIAAAAILVTLHFGLAVLACQRIQNGGEGAFCWLALCAFSGIVVATLLLSQVSRLSAVRTCDSK